MFQPVATYKCTRTGHVFDIMPTILPDHYYKYQRNYNGIFAWGACSDYDTDIHAWLLYDIEQGIIEMVSGNLPIPQSSRQRENSENILSNWRENY